MATKLFKNVDKETSKRMSLIRSKNTKLEVGLRKQLFSMGHRYRIHYEKAFGKPDIVFPRQKVAVFVDSHFWHGYDFNKLKNKVFRNKKYWIEKIERNIRRDRLVNKKLREDGWTVLRFWEHQIKNSLDNCVKIIENHLKENLDD